MLMEVAFEPYKKVTFQSYMQFKNSEEFANAIAMATPAGIPIQMRLFWANGILFRFFNHPPSEILVQEFINGHLIWDHIEFALMPEYRNELRVTERPLLALNILNVSDHVVFGPVAKWIRNSLVERKSSK
jgi:hypothetical protein